MLTLPTPPAARSAASDDASTKKKKVLQSVYLCDDADAMRDWRIAVEASETRGLKSANAFAAYAIELVSQNDAAIQLANIVDAMDWIAANDVDDLVDRAEDAIANTDDAAYIDELKTFIRDARDARAAARTQALDGIEYIQTYIADVCDVIGVELDGSPA